MSKETRANLVQYSPKFIYAKGTAPFSMRTTDFAKKDLKKLMNTRSQQIVRQTIKIEFEIAGKYIGGVEDSCDMCGREGRVIFYQLDMVGRKSSLIFSLFLCSNCLKKLKSTPNAKR